MKPRATLCGALAVVVVVVLSAGRRVAEHESVTPPVLGTLVLDLDTDPGVAWIRGVDQAGPDVASGLRLYPADAEWSDPTVPPIAGTVEPADGAVRFSPNHPLLPGRHYVAVLAAPGSRHPLTAWARAPESTTLTAPRVVSIHPTVDALPANQLRLYVTFSRPMSTWDPYDHIRLVDETSGEPVEQAFHALRDGLWDPRGERMTIVFDPGRLKRGVNTHEMLGAPLREGHRYRLVILGTWPDAQGRPIGHDFVKRFNVEAPDRDRPDPRAWTVQAPRAGSMEPVVVDFGEAMDRALVERMVRIRGASGRPIEHEVKIGPTARRWMATPLRPWASGDLEAVVDCRVEDLAGNNVERLFDSDLRDGEPSHESAEGACTVTVPFTVTTEPRGSAFTVEKGGER